MRWLMVVMVLAQAGSATAASSQADTFAPIQTGPATNCAATQAFNKTAMGLNMNDSDGVYTCDGDICWLTNAGFDSGDVAWMLFATTFVMLQTPATGFAQGGLVRRKNAMSVIGQSFIGVVVGCLQWYVWGYSLTFGPDSGNGFIGDPSTYAWFENVSPYNCIEGQTIPHLLYAAFQMTFALMVPVLITGAWAEKFSLFSAVQFMIIWPVLVYYPTAHWVWGGGWLAANPYNSDESRAVDYAGGIVIHTASGIASLVVALVLQKRRAFKQGSDEYTSNLPLTMVGIALVWVGWYSFNGGSGLRANGQAVSALFVTQIAACTSAAVWCACSYFDDGYVQITHLGSGALAGLAGITPGSGYVSHLAGVPYGIIVGLCSFYGGKALKERLKLDDVLDVTSLQAIPGAVGSILVGFFADSRVLPCAGPEFPGKACDGTDDHLDGVLYGGNGDLLAWQLAAVIVQIVWTAVFTFITLKIIEAVNLCCRGRLSSWSLYTVYGLDVPAEYESLGLDRACHGEKAYDLDYHDQEDEVVMAAELCSHAAKGDLAALKKNIRLGADASHSDVDGRTPLHLAARGGHVDVMNYLVNFCRVNVNAEDHFKSRPIKDAKQAGMADAVAWLLRNGARDEAPEKDADHLREAAHRGETAEVQALIAGGVDVNSSDYDGRTALHIAASEGKTDVVAALLKGGADRTATDRFGSMPIHDAQRYKHDGIVRLIREGCDVDFDHLVASSVRRASSINHDSGASTRELLQAAQAGNLGDIKRLRRKGCNLLTVDYDQRTALHVAAKAGHYAVVAYLVDVVPGINVNVQDASKNTPYSEALAAGHGAVAEYLADHGATPINDAVTGQALCKAASDGNLEEIKRLVKEGKRLRAADYDGRTALHLAAARGHTAIVDYLVNPGGGHEGIRVDSTDRWNGTPLEDAERCGKAETAQRLRKLGAVDRGHSALYADRIPLAVEEIDDVMVKVDAAPPASGTVARGQPYSIQAADVVMNSSSV